MAKIRTVKPDLFRHPGLYNAEAQTGLPLRLAFIGLFTAVDREGRFAWVPDTLKLDCLPFDRLDFGKVLDALAAHGFIVAYLVENKKYGYIPTWKNHQHINAKEAPSRLPSVYGEFTVLLPSVPPMEVEVEVEVEVEGKGIDKTLAQPAAAKAARLPKATAPGFDTFWQAYPKRKGRGAALAQWRSLKPDLQVCLDALQWQTRDEGWTKDGGKWIPWPQKWIKEQRWLDEQESGRGTGRGEGWTPPSGGDDF